MANTVSLAEVLADVKGQTGTWTSEATSFLQTLKDNASAELEIDIPGVPDDLPRTVFSPSLFVRIGQEPVVPASLLFTAPGTEPGAFRSAVTISAPELVQIPDYNLAAPAVSLPTRPELTTPDAPTAPLVDDVSVPTAPTIELPTAPTLQSVVFPDAPTLSLPEFAEAAPEAPASFLQTTQFEYQDAVFDVPLLDAVRGKLLTDVQDGGYGIEPTDENALWERARDREIRQLSADESTVEEAYAGRGYSLPPGAMQAALQRAREAAQDRVSETAREIALKRADLFRDTRRFSLEHGLSVENARLQHYGFSMERALNAQRFAAEYAIQIHDAYIRQFNAELQRYSTLADVYRTRLQAALTQIQIYEAEVRAAVARQDASRLDVELYQALLQAATTRVGLFEAQLRGAGLVADIQRLKVDTYRAEVGAFASRVSANESQLRTYEAGIRGELAKVDIFRAEVGAYSDRVRASATEQAARNERAQVLVQQKGAELEEYRAKIARYQQNIAAESQRVETLLSKYRNDTAVYTAALGGYEALARVDLNESDAQVQAIQEQTKRHQTNAQLQLESAAKTLETRFTAANAGADITSSFINAGRAMLQAVVVEQQTTEA